MSRAEDTVNLVGLDFVVDDVLELKSNLRMTVSNKNVGWLDEDPLSLNVGNIYLPEGAKELKVKNNGYRTLAIKGIKLTYVEDGDASEDIVIYGSNAISGFELKNDGSFNYNQGFHHQGVDYYDAAGLAFTKVVSANSAVIHHSGDWTKYDISDFKTGTYLVTFNTSQPNDISVALKINDKTALEGSAPANGAYGTNYVDYELGKIYISDEAETLTLENITNNAYYAQYLKFEYLSEERDEDTLPSYEILGSDIYSTVPEEGFHANTLYDNVTDKLETSGTSATLRGAGEWAAYDVSDLESGTYKLTVNASTKATEASSKLLYLDTFLDDVLLSKTQVIGADSGNYTAADYEFPNIKIDSSSKVLKVRSSGNIAVFLNKLTLTLVESQAEEAYKVRQYADNITMRDEIAEGEEKGAIVIANGVDYYDTDGGIYTKVVIGGVARLNPTEWARYDLSGLKHGKYKVTANYSTATYASALSFKVNNEIVLRAPLTNVNKTAVGTDYYNLELGYIYIGEGEDYIIVENSGTRIAWLNYIDFELVEGDESGMPMYSLDAYVVTDHYNTSNSGNLESAQGQPYYGTTLRATCWNTYDISGFKPGTYELSITYGARGGSKVSVQVDDVPRLNSTDVNVVDKDSYFTIAEQKIGNVYIGEDAETITLTNTASSTLSIHKINFKYLYDEATIRATLPLLVDGEIVAGESYYDSDGSQGFQTDGSAVIREGDWVKYDLSAFDLAPGIYNVYGVLQNQAGKGATIVEIEANDRVVTTNVPEGTDLDSRALLGTILVDEDTGWLKVSVLSVNRMRLMELIIDDDVEKATTVSYSSDEEGIAPIASLAGLEKAFVNFSLVRPEQAEIAETVYVALYDGARLKSVMPLPATSAFEFADTYEVTGLADCVSPVIKTFVWENDSYAPIISTTGTTITAE